MNDKENKEAERKNQNRLMEGKTDRSKRLYSQTNTPNRLSVHSMEWRTLQR
jgi:hypothetical protein